VNRACARRLFCFHLTPINSRSVALFQLNCSGLEIPMLGESSHDYHTRGVGSPWQIPECFGASEWQELQEQAFPDRTGRCDARNWATLPPMECPTRTNLRSPSTRAIRPASRARSRIEYPSVGASDPPHPRWSYAIHRKSAESRCVNVLHVRADPPQ
jgi:hypothetical protein